ncbi:hypothetical protein HDK64DRAFT_88783 [Phyllosticta capitalensis]
MPPYYCVRFYRHGQYQLQRHPRHLQRLQAMEGAAHHVHRSALANGKQSISLKNCKETWKDLHSARISNKSSHQPIWSHVIHHKEVKTVNIDNTRQVMTDVILRSKLRKFQVVRWQAQLYTLSVALEWVIIISFDLEIGQLGAGLNARIGFPLFDTGLHLFGLFGMLPHRFLQWTSRRSARGGRRRAFPFLACGHRKRRRGLIGIAVVGLLFPPPTNTGLRFVGGRFVAIFRLAFSIIVAHEAEALTDAVGRMSYGRFSNEDSSFDSKMVRKCYSLSCSRSVSHVRKSFR